MTEFLTYLLVAVMLVAMFFMALPLIAAIACSVVLLIIFGTKPIWAP